MSTPRPFRPASYKPPRIATPKFPKVASYKPPKVAAPKFPKVASYKPPRVPPLPKPPRAPAYKPPKAIKLPRSSAVFPKMPRASRPPAPTMLPRASGRAPSFGSARPTVFYQEPYPYPYPYRSRHPLLRIAIGAFLGYKLSRWFGRRPVFPTGPLPGGNVVYAIEGAMDHIKIGTTTDLPARVRELQTGSPVPLRVLAVCPGDRRLESALHHVYARYRVSGEWFALPETERQALLAQMQG
jgi:Meiotically up-regulated gene 113